MRLYQLNRRIKPTDPQFRDVIQSIAADIAVSLAPFEDEQRQAIISQAIEFAEKASDIRDLYRMIEIYND